MNNIIGVSIGSVHGLGGSMESVLELISKTSASAVEISFLKDFEIKMKVSQSSVDYLIRQNYVSIHAPMFHGESFVPYFNFDMNNLRRWYTQINAKAIVFHPHQKIPASEKDMQFCVENVPNFRIRGVDLMKRLAEAKLSEKPELRLILDSCHALQYPGYMEEIVEKYHDRIQHVHLSDRRYNYKKKKIRNHQTFAECPDKEKFNCLRQLDCPIIIEISPDKNDYFGYLELLKREVGSVREFFR